MFINSIMQTDFDLTCLSTMHITAKCKYFFDIGSVCDLRKILERLREENVRYFILGKGSNTLLAKTDNLAVLHFGKKFSNVAIDETNCEITAESGKSVVSLAKQLANLGLSGFEFASGIPASVGGLVAMNAGAYNCEVKDIIKCVTAYDVDSEQIVVLTKAECEFSYRSSIFSDKLIILEATFCLKRKTHDEIIAKMRENFEKRKASQPIDKFSLGSIFLSNENKIAYLIDKMQLKGYNIGGAEISSKHSGFIVCKSGCSAEDVLKLIDYIKCKLREEYKIEGKEEIRIVK